MSNNKSNNEKTTLISVLFLMLIFASALIILPNMFASADSIADSNNMTTSEYASQYDTGQDFLQMFLIAIYIILILLAVVGMISVIRLITG